MAMKYSSLLLLSYLIGFSSIRGQTSVSNDNLWISGGIGGFFTNKVDYDIYGAFSFYLSADWLRNKFVDTVDGPKHWNTKWEIRLIDHLEMIHEDVVLSHYDLGLLYGKSISFGKVFQVNISGGAGVFKREKEVYSDPGPNPISGPIPKIEQYYTFNIPLEFELCMIPSKYFGIGIAGFANLNTKRNINGIVVKLEIGKRK